MADTTVNSAAAPELSAIFEQHRARVFRFILASTRDRDAAETLTQDCFLKAHQALHAFRGECSIETWLLKIALNLVRDHARNRRLQFWRKTQSGSAAPEDLDYLLRDQRQSAETNILVSEQIRAVWLALENLSQRQRTVFLLRFVEDLDLLEIAEATGLREGTVKTHLFRALQAVREEIGYGK